MALIYLGFGENEKALQYLRKASKERETDLAYLQIDPIFDPIRDNEEFKKLALKYK